MRLFYAPGACSLSPHIVARELAIDLQLEKVDLPPRTTASGRDYLSINAKGYIPALELDSGEILTEGTTIVQYLADQRPEAMLIPPPNSMGRYRVQEMLAYINSEIHKNYNPLIYSGTSKIRRAEAAHDLQRCYTFLERHLASHEYLANDHYSVADVYLFTVTSWAAFARFSLSRFPGVLLFQERIAARPAVKQALREEGLTYEP